MSNQLDKKLLVFKVPIGNLRGEKATEWVAKISRDLDFKVPDDTRLIYLPVREGDWGVYLFNLASGELETSTDFTSMFPLIINTPTPTTIPPKRRFWSRWF